VHPTIKVELFPSAPGPLPGAGFLAPPPPITTAPKAFPPVTDIQLVCKTPPAPPPPELSIPADPPPATTNVFINLVPACVVTALGALDVLVVTVHFPKEVVLLLPIIPPFAEPDGLAIS
jgi:hypothetical protein